MKKIVLTGLLIITTLSVYSTELLGRFDDAFSIEENRRERGLALGFYLQPLVVENEMYDTKRKCSSFIFDPAERIAHDPRLMIPVISFSYVERFGLKNDREFAFDFGIEAYNKEQGGPFGPDLVWDFSIKKSVSTGGNGYFAYKFNWAVLFHSTPGLEAAMKHALLFGSRYQARRFTFSIFVQNGAGINFMPGIFDFFDIRPFSLKCMPGIELTWEREHKRGFVTGNSFFCTYEIACAIGREYSLHSNKVSYGSTKGLLRCGYGLVWKRHKELK